MYTFGYGGRSLEEFIELTKAVGTELVVDVRRWNTSRRNPEFSGPNLERNLMQHNIAYRWFPVLGGYREFGVDVEDLNIAHCFESRGFRAYATYITSSPVVKPYLSMLVDLLLQYRVGLLCAERYPWRCHRKILSDYLVARGFRVLHVIDEKAIYEHKLSECAVVENNELRYI